jgi:hypothetical protein
MKIMLSESLFNGISSPPAAVAAASVRQEKKRKVENGEKLSNHKGK